MEKKFLIIGSGPSGLLCSIELAKCGFYSTVIDKRLTYDRRGYVHSKYIKPKIREIIKELEEHNIKDIIKYNSQSGKNKTFSIQSVKSRLESNDDELLIQIKELEAIFRTYIDLLLKDKVNVKMGVNFDYNSLLYKNGKNFYTFDDNNIEFDDIINASGWNPDFYTNILKNLPENQGKDSTEIKNEEIITHDLDDKYRHSIIIMKNINPDKPLDEDLDYDKNALQKDLKQLGYEDTVCFKTIDRNAKTSDFLIPNPKLVLVIIKAPDKDKVLVVGPVPDSAKTQDQIIKIAQTLLKYKFPTNSFALDKQAESRHKDITEDAWQRKIKKDSLNPCIFNVNCNHVKNPVNKFNSFALVNLGDSCLAPYYPNGEGLKHTILEIDKILQNINDKSKMNEEIKEVIQNNINQKQSCGMIR